MIGFSSASGPGLSGQNSGGSVPLGENMMISRFRVGAPTAAPLTLGRPIKNGAAVAATPVLLRNCRRVEWSMVFLCRLLFGCPL